jgi:hypothetical protein
MKMWAQHDFISLLFPSKEVNFGLKVMFMSSLYVFLGFIFFGALGFTAILGHGPLDF